MTTNDSTFYQDVGARIREARNLAQINQETLATQLGLTRASVINLEKGRHRPSLIQLLEIANVLMCDYTSLIPVSVPVHIDNHKLAIDIKNAVSSDPVNKAALVSAVKMLKSGR
jgi:transcriptional regulator with XRE-family HTH domain